MSELKSSGGSPAVLTYEERLSADLELAMSEGSRFFAGDSDVHKALRRIAARLSELDIPYAVAGGMALVAHGYRRFTDDVDILVTAEGLERIHEALDGRGFVRPFAASKNLRETETRVKIEFLVAGQYPGDGREKPVRFPEPAAVRLEREGIAFLNLPTLVELKLASGMSGAGRRKDLADVQELVKALDLPRDFGGQLNEYVRLTYEELYDEVHGPPGAS
ncbi:MAG TPA: hypothetical protein VGN57_08690 [Pirellulaceae bacterium]|jgi:hypothetical protein|nr:hypothetical protein [Pirellulaceae bacterium]